MDKAQIERLTQLTRLVQGKETKRTPAEILAAEKAAAEKYRAKSAPSTKGTTTPELVQDE